MDWSSYGRSKIVFCEKGLLFDGHFYVVFNGVWWSDIFSYSSCIVVSTRQIV